MALLDDMLAADAVGIFANADASFEIEAVTIHGPLGAYTASAQVFREMIDQVAGNVRQRKLSAFVARVGVLDADGLPVIVELQRGWHVTISDERGGQVQKHMVKDLFADAGGWMLTL